MPRKNETLANGIRLACRVQKDAIDKDATEACAARRKEIEDAEKAVDLINLHQLINIIRDDKTVEQWMESVNAAQYAYDSNDPRYSHGLIDARILAHKEGKTKLVIYDVAV